MVIWAACRQGALSFWWTASGMGKGNLVIKGLVEEMLDRLRGVNGLIEPDEATRGSSSWRTS